MFFLKFKLYFYNFFSNNFFQNLFNYPFAVILNFTKYLKFNNKLNIFYKNINIDLVWFAEILFWLKTRVSYALNSWVYTTNHKRIAVNYFSVVMIAGTGGMSLASVIRLEFAYPGVGVLAGDSIQYLSICTAHGAVMVFFMIMPALYGAFGNFLLPTQLGVHDVAFPRLNSAAFWFFPGGLIMIFQLVCIDRRYQRMNCFNIRELQGILKRKFFTDLVNTNDHRELLNNSIINLRYKVNSNNLIENDMLMFYNYGLTFSLKNKENKLENNLFSNYNFFNFNYFSKPIISIYTTFTNFNFNINFFNNFLDLFSNFFKNLNVNSLFSSYLILFYIKDIIYFNFNIISSFKYKVFNNSQLNEHNIFYKSENLETTTSINVSSSELSNTGRFNRFSNPIISYDYKCGHYLGIWDQLYPSLVNSIIEVARGIRKPLWYFSDQYNDLLKKNYNNYTVRFFNKKNLKLAEVENWYSSHVSPMDNYFNLFSIYQNNQNTLNSRWVSLNSLNQKFYKMFNTSSIQQRVLANWRQLKFTREAWRCKLLASRNQNTLYKRFLSEEGLVYSIERNAKDLLPGWTIITPFSARTRYTAVGRTDIAIIGIFTVLNASIVSSANFLVTYKYLSTLNNRKMRDARSFFSESLIVGSWMILAANPMLAIALVMLIMDRHWQTSFFDYSGGGDSVLFQHMFWFFGHPEVYIIMIPIFGLVNTAISFYLRKRISARGSLMYSMYTIAFLGFFVWGHHMYMVGLAHTTRMLFSTLTVMISVPAATKLMHWSVTVVNSFFTMEIPFLWSFSFIYMFVSGGVSGMACANTGIDVLIHDTFYVVGHFHVMLAGSGMMGIFAGYYFYFPVIYGTKFSRIYAYLHYVFYVLGQFMVILPMLWLGYCGMPRRVLDFPSAFGGWHSISSAGHLTLVFGMLFFFFMTYDSVRQAKPTIRNNFGVGRFNTRLNFYFFEINRLSYLQRKSFNSYRFKKKSNFNNIKLEYFKLYNIETTLFSYQFFKL